MSRYTERAKEYSIKYARENLKRVPFDVQLEEYEQIKTAADAAGLPVNTFIKLAIREKIERDGAK